MKLLIVALLCALSYAQTESSAEVGISDLVLAIPGGRQSYSVYTYTAPACWETEFVILSLKPKSSPLIIRITLTHFRNDTFQGILYDEDGRNTTGHSYKILPGDYFKVECEFDSSGYDDDWVPTGEGHCIMIMEYSGPPIPECYALNEVFDQSFYMLHAEHWDIEAFQNSSLATNFDWDDIRRIFGYIIYFDVLIYQTNLTITIYIRHSAASIFDNVLGETPNVNILGTEFSWRNITYEATSFDDSLPSLSPWPIAILGSVTLLITAAACGFEERLRHYQANSHLFFGAYGKFIAQRPCTVICGSILIFFVTALGNLFIETSSDEYYIKQLSTEGNESYDHRLLKDDLGGSSSYEGYEWPDTIYTVEENSTSGGASESQDVFVAILKSSGNMCSRENVELYLDWEINFQNVEAETADGSIHPFHEVFGSGWNPNSFGKYLSYDIANFDKGVPDLETIVFEVDALPSPMRKMISDPIFNEEGLLTGCRALQFTNRYNWNTTRWGSDEEFVNNWRRDKHKDYCKNYPLPDDVSIAYGYEAALKDEVKEAASKDVIFIAVCAVLIIFLMHAFLFRIHNCTLALGSINLLSIFMSILAANGMCVYSGMPFTEFLIIGWFLIIGVGMDDMFVLVRAFEVFGDEENSVNRMEKTMKSGGMSIFVTSISNFLCFAVGMTSPWGYVRSISIFCGFGVLFTLLFQLTFFAGFMYWLNPQTKTSEFSGYLKRYMTLQALPISQISAGIVWMIYIVVSFIGLVQIQQGTDILDIIPSNSFWHEFLSQKGEYFLATWRADIFIYGDNIEMWRPDVMDAIKAIESEIKNNEECVVYQTYQPALTGFSNWAHSMRLDITTRDGFIHALNIWRDVPYQSAIATLQTDWKVDSNKNIRMVRAGLFTKGHDGDTLPKRLTKCHFKFQKFQDDTSIPTADWFIYGKEWDRVEGESLLKSATIESLILASLASFLVCVITLSSFRVAFIVLANLISIMVGVIGFCYWRNMEIDQTLLIGLILAIGFSLDNSCHYCYTFQEAPYKSTLERNIYAMNLSGIALFQGDFTLLAGLFCTIFVQFSLLRILCWTILLVMIFGIIHTLLFLPVLMLWIGPEGRYEKAHEHEVELPESSAPAKDV